MDTPSLNLNLLVRLAHQHAVEKGFWGPHKSVPHAVAVNRTPEKLALIHEEASEALHDWRKDPSFPETTMDGQKPVGFATELADIVIRVADLAGAFKIDLEDAVRQKINYNATRGQLHGDVVR